MCLIPEHSYQWLSIWIEQGVASGNLERNANELSRVN